MGINDFCVVSTILIDIHSSTETPSFPKYYKVIF